MDDRLAFFADENGKVRRGEEQVISESNRRGTYTRLSLALPDVDNDSVKITYKDRYKVYTNPRVLAVLRMRPMLRIWSRHRLSGVGRHVIRGKGHGDIPGLCRWRRLLGVAHRGADRRPWSR